MEVDMEAVQLPSEFACQVHSTIGQNLYLKPQYADFYFNFEVGNGEIERVPAHKLLLATGSEVFQTMFNGSWSEVKEVLITDAKCAPFKEFLQCFYLSQVTFTEENMDGVINLGKKYMVPECLRICLEFYKNNLTYENVCSAYGSAIFYDQHDLKKLCETMIAANTPALFRSNSFSTCDRELLKYILDLDDLSCSEFEVFEALLKWVRPVNHEGNLTREMVQSELGEFFYQIRFGSLSTEQFATLHQMHSQLFTDVETVEIFKICSSPDYQPLFFTAKRRQRYGFGIGVGYSLECIRLLSDFGSNIPYFIKNTETTVFSSSQPFLLKSIYCVKLTFYDNDIYSQMPNAMVQSKMTIIEKPNISNEDGASTLDVIKANLYSTHTTCIDLPKPILVRPGHFYLIRIEQIAPLKCCTAALLKSVASIGTDITITFHEDSTVDTDRTPRGLVSGFIVQTII